MRAKLEQVIYQEGLGSAVILVGHVEDVRPYLASFSLFACSSYAEGVPIAILEAMAMGLPIVSPRVGGIESLVEEGSAGRLIESNDVGGLAATLLEMLADPVKMEEMGRAARERVITQFTVSAMVDQVQDMYDEVRMWRSDGNMSCLPSDPSRGGPHPDE